MISGSQQTSSKEEASAMCDSLRLRREFSWRSRYQVSWKLFSVVTKHMCAQAGSYFLSASRISHKSVPKLKWFCCFLVEGLDKE
jgi:hypothetical protein